MSKILVTGGAGFIGAHVATKLLERGDDVVIIDDFNDRYDPRLKHLRFEHFFSGSLKPKLVTGDIRDNDLITKLFDQEKFNHVIHLAAWAAVQTSIDNPYIYTSVNVDGTVNVFEAARHNDVKNIVFASSSSVYGGRDKVPFQEKDDVSRPISPYAATKAAGEIMCATWYNLYQIPISALRFFTVYGPWGRPEMAIFKFSEAILRGQPLLMRGHQTMRDFTFIDDCVQGVISALDHPHQFSIFNLGESDAVPLPRLISALEHSFNKPALIQEVPLPPGDVPRTLADISLAQAMLSYQPVTKIEDGIAKFTQWYKEWYIPNFLPDLTNSL
ncbi:MAG: hypothetical protein A3E37_03225 [Candidatus Andersenbacteria bacterium RIFCSPHIGHO2_12_FULL_46_9]|nr:MAG: NAD-dependent epimerase/dehydratase [Parcubacteria group bacterium GW2011_GWA2_45_14]OGY33805.1 MAG: hypothetical protein A3B76_03000 [Candidatus Andersenbacteria bacterium RIFCSPHIGHO2_02_FULL_46_16]OGY36240.1 MAG: hypothetical protein A3I08_05320 [Candidatus Andersenbacteria bacterium RIFCSPLOWO2_02_FULL_46_11]OGY36675.1 MAG: hypothetical protein A3E37_03225 [Candidatus Andersenbacteria bacterium RIFCSPHIGHO2_12_FULL_46_9]OGY42736.1 MAG: hypothetical protein A3G57_03215 [Candidatus An